MSRGPSALNALVAVNKPLGLSSHDVVNRVRRAVGEKRVGHAGTLDPAASGVLVIGIGQATKLLGMLTLDRKAYVAQVEFGSATDTDDSEGEVVRTAPVPHELSDPAFAAEALHGLLGEQDQVPPAYSAISVNGRRAYALARDGKQVELAARHVTVHAADLVSVESGEKCVWTCAFDVSKGTYVRSLARDLGERLGTCAHLCGLVRTQAGGVCLGDCVDLDELAEGGKSLVVERCLDPVALLGLPRRDLALGELADVSCGRKIEVGEVFARGERREPRPEERVALVFDGALAGIWERRGASLACQTNFPQAIEGVK